MSVSIYHLGNLSNDLTWEFGSLSDYSLQDMGIRILFNRTTSLGSLRLWATGV